MNCRNSGKVNTGWCFDGLDYRSGVVDRLLLTGVEYFDLQSVIPYAGAVTFDTIASISPCV